MQLYFIFYMEYIDIKIYNNNNYYYYYYYWIFFKIFIFYFLIK